MTGRPALAHRIFWRYAAGAYSQQISQRKSALGDLMRQAAGQSLRCGSAPGARYRVRVALLVRDWCVSAWLERSGTPFLELSPAAGAQPGELRGVPVRRRCSSAYASSSGRTGGASPGKPGIGNGTSRIAGRVLSACRWSTGVPLPQLRAATRARAVIFLGCCLVRILGWNTKLGVAWQPGAPVSTVDQSMRAKSRRQRRHRAGGQHRTIRAKRSSACPASWGSRLVTHPQRQAH